jgi:protein TonB
MKRSLNIRVIEIPAAAPEVRINEGRPLETATVGVFMEQPKSLTADLEPKPPKKEEPPLPVEKKRKPDLLKKSKRIKRPQVPDHELASPHPVAHHSQEQGPTEISTPTPDALPPAAAEAEAHPPKAMAIGDASGGKGASTGLFREATPSYLDNPPPAYPAIARRKGYEGTVILEVFVDEGGNASQIRIHTSSGYGILDKAAAQAVSGWKFNPAIKGGVPAATTIKVPVVFKLE